MRVLALLIIVFSGCSCANLVKKIDPQTAVGGNDLTVLMSTGDKQVGVGFLVSRQVESGDASKEYVIFHAPPDLNCDLESCFYYRIFFPDGRPSFEGAIKRGDSTSSVPWSMITNQPHFELNTRGLYGVSVTLHFKGPNGEPMKSYADGYLFLIVTKREYLSLLSESEDENYVWNWTTKDHQLIRLTTGFRAYVSSGAVK